MRHTCLSPARGALPCSGHACTTPVSPLMLWPHAFHSKSKSDLLRPTVAGYGYGTHCATPMRASQQTVNVHTGSASSVTLPAML
eukprot:12255717-Alexandrium_andersonii.AAC.1